MLTYAGSDRKKILQLGAGVAVLWVAAGIALGTHYDYRLYVMQWARIMAGDDPWIGDPTNAYGPGNALLAPLAQIHHLLPKLLFLLSWIGVCLIVFVAAGRDVVIGVASSLVLLFAPFFFILVNIYGVGDTLVTFLTLLAVDLRVRKGQSVLPAILLVLAGFIKIYPLILIPFLATDRGIISFRFIIAVTTACAIGALLTYAAWGSSVLYIFDFASTRGGKLLSIFVFLERSGLSPVAGTAFAHALIVWNTVVLGLTLAGVYAFHFLKKLPTLSGTVIAMLAMLTVYKVGNPQYFICGVVLLIYYLAVEIRRDFLDRGLLLAAGGYLLVLSLYESWYILVNGDPPASTFIGLPTFIAAVVLLWRLIGPAIRNEPSAVRAPALS